MSSVGKYNYRLTALTALVTFIAGIVCFTIRLDPFQIAIIISITYIGSILLNTFGLFIIPGQVTLGTFYSYISGYGLLIIGLVIAGYLTVGWQGVVAYFIGKFIGWCVARVIEIVETKRLFKLTGFAFTASERCFFNAYRLHAAKHGVTTDIDVSEEEMEEDNWRPAFEDLALEWPQVVARFTKDYNEDITI